MFGKVMILMPLVNFEFTRLYYLLLFLCLSVCLVHLWWWWWGNGPKQCIDHFLFSSHVTIATGLTDCPLTHCYKCGFIHIRRRSMFNDRMRDETTPHKQTNMIVSFQCDWLCATYMQMLHSNKRVSFFCSISYLYVSNYESNQCSIRYRQTGQQQQEQQQQQQHHARPPIRIQCNRLPIYLQDHQWRTLLTMTYRVSFSSFFLYYFSLHSSCPIDL